MRVSFTKMHGLGNDFIVIDSREIAVPAMTPALARHLADRRTGIGCDQLIMLHPSDHADFRMRIFNSDGSEVESCGNATRAVGLLHGQAATIETGGGILHARPGRDGIAVDMGKPRFSWDAIPLAYPMDTLAMPVGWETLENPVAVNVGNPHVVFFVPDCDEVELEILGPMIETDPIFPQRINVNVAQIVDANHIRLRVWERGVGLTRACGTGACASAIAAMRRGLVERDVNVSLPGGMLQIGWNDEDHIIMTGGATESFRGSFEWDDYS